LSPYLQSSLLPKAGRGREGRGFVIIAFLKLLIWEFLIAELVNLPKYVSPSSEASQRLGVVAFQG